MTLENPLLIGIILIIVGIATALIAAAILLNRRDSGDNQDKTNKETDSDQTQAAPVQLSNTVEQKPDSPPADSTPSDSKTAEQAHSNPPEASLSSVDKSSPPPLASLKRDSTTGRLLLEIGGREYTSPGQLRSSSDWPLIKQSLEELSAWIHHEPVPEDRSGSTTPLRKSRAPEKKPRNKKPAVAPQPTSMVDQINEIIEEKIRLSGETHLSVRLIEGLHGEIKALIGVESFPVQDIPDEEVRNFIRECVTEWEQKA